LCTSVDRSKCYNAHPVMYSTCKVEARSQALRISCDAQVAKSRISASPNGVEHFAWGVAEAGLSWEKSVAFTEGLSEVAWPTKAQALAG
jgi:hypothetical protein